MSEKYIQIASFKYGLDTRREELVSQPGVLVQCENARINSGGEIVKRKAFVRADELFPTNTFGLQDTDEGLMTFGSDVSPSGSLPFIGGEQVVYQRLLPTFLSNPQPIQTVSLAGTGAVNGVYSLVGVFNGKAFYGDITTEYIAWNGSAWQIIYHSAGSSYVAYTSTEDVLTPDLVVTWTVGSGGTGPVPTVAFSPSVIGQMTNVIFSSNYLGKAFVIAQFGDLSLTYQFTFCFYDGQLVFPSRNGLVLLNGSSVTETNSDLSTDLAEQVNLLTGWVGKANTTATPWTQNSVTKVYNLHESTLAGTTLVESPPGIYFEPTVSQDSTDGVVAIQLIDSDFPGVAASRAVAAFTLGGTGAVGDTVTVTAPLESGGTGTAALSGAVAFNTSLSQTATDVAAAINATTYIYGYTASSVGAVVTVQAPLDFGAFTYNLSVTVVTTSSLAASVGTAGGNFALTLTPNVVTLTGGSTFFNLFLSKTVAASYIQAVQLPTFVWAECNADGTTPPAALSGIKISSLTAPTVTFSGIIPRFTSLKGYFKCTATSVGATPTDVTAIISVSMENVGG